ncbi:Cysteine hydrolase [Tulasnella sp. 418]|nr:Cysteine hydrolase [Tulasnella sp. 418]
MFTRLPQELFSRGIEKVVIVGLATDYCVRATAIDARKFNLDTIVITDGVRGVFPDNEERVLDELRRWGTRTVSLDEFAGCCKTS